MKMILNTELRPKQNNKARLVRYMAPLFKAIQFSRKFSKQMDDPGIILKKKKIIEWPCHHL